MRAIALWSLSCLICLSGCHGKPECDSFETRNAVLQTVSDDHNNALVKFAAKKFGYGKTRWREPGS
jgi:hypothetical protein